MATAKSAYERLELLRRAGEHSKAATLQETPTGSPHVAILHYLSAMELLTEAVGDMFQLTDGRKKVPPGCEKSAPSGSPPAFSSPLSEVFLQTVVKGKLRQYEERVRMLMEVCEAEEKEKASADTTTYSTPQNNAQTTSYGSVYPPGGGGATEGAYIYPEDGRSPQCHYQPPQQQQHVGGGGLPSIPAHVVGDGLHDDYIAVGGESAPHTVVASRTKAASVSEAATQPIVAHGPRKGGDDLRPLVVDSHSGNDAALPSTNGGGANVVAHTTNSGEGLNSLTATANTEEDNKKHASYALPSDADYSRPPAPPSWVTRSSTTAGPYAPHHDETTNDEGEGHEDSGRNVQNSSYYCTNGGSLGSSSHPPPVGGKVEIGEGIGSSERRPSASNLPPSVPLREEDGTTTTTTTTTVEGGDEATLLSYEDVPSSSNPSATSGAHSADSKSDNGASRPSNTQDRGNDTAQLLVTSSYTSSAENGSAPSIEHITTAGPAPEIFLNSNNTTDSNSFGGGGGGAAMMRGETLPRQAHDTDSAPELTPAAFASSVMRNQSTASPEHKDGPTSATSTSTHAVVPLSEASHPAPPSAIRRFGDDNNSDTFDAVFNAFLENGK